MHRLSVSLVMFALVALLASDGLTPSGAVESESQPAVESTSLMSDGARPTPADETNLHERHHHHHHAHEHEKRDVRTHDRRDAAEATEVDSQSVESTSGAPSAASPGQQYYNQYYNPTPTTHGHMKGGSQTQQGGASSYQNGGGSGYDYSQYYPRPNAGGGGAAAAGGGGDASESIRSGAEGSSNNIRASGEMAQGFMPGHQQPQSSTPTVSHHPRSESDERRRHESHHHYSSPHEHEKHDEHDDDRHDRVDLPVPVATLHLANTMTQADAADAVESIQLSETSHTHKHKHEREHEHDGKSIEAGEVAPVPTQHELNAGWQKIGQQYAKAFVPARSDSDHPDPTASVVAATTVAASPLITEEEPDLPPIDPASLTAQPTDDAEPEEPAEDPVPEPATAPSGENDHESGGVRNERTERAERDEREERFEEPLAAATTQLMARRRRSHQKEQKQQAEQQQWKEVGMAYKEQYAPAPGSESADSHSGRVAARSQVAVEAADSTLLASRDHESKNALDRMTRDPANMARAQRKAAERNEQMAKRIRRHNAELREEQQERSADHPDAAAIVSTSDVNSRLVDEVASALPSTPFSFTKLMLMIVATTVVFTSLWLVYDTRTRNHTYEQIQSETV
jgi:hypothetical protein